MRQSEKYKEQKEYRIVFDDICQAEYIEENIDGIKVPVFKNVKPKDDYCIGNIKDISKCFEFDVANRCNDIELKL